MKRTIALTFFVFVVLSSCGGDDETGPSSNPENIVFQNNPPAQIDHNRMFNYQPLVNDINGAPVTIEIGAVPGWLELNEETLRVSGTPDWPRLNTSFRLNIMATNGVDTAYQRSDIRVSLGEILCGANFGPPEESEFILPYNVGESYRMWQSYCHPQWSHKNWFSYDFEMPMGTEILASRSGTVIFVRDNFRDHTRVSGEENFVFIEHSDGTVTHYVHIMQGGARVEKGQFVAQGQLIALSGDSGGSAGPHLHTSRFIGKTNFDRQYSIPMNYKNAEGPLNVKKGLIIDKFYTAKEY